ncbi:MAG: hypothetical protein U1E06_03495 [Tabrizicola sp.]|nr:hypothetical protein [Tabrizicola sp.]MDP3648472.1 hypothetical protein [Paracoccaceae bacterium]MDZ4065902.1 hypothetical protein [Tabrizicola sp.]
MKRVILAALLSTCGLPALAETSSFDGCEVKQIENSNAFYRVDPTCSFNNFKVDEGSDPVLRKGFGEPPRFGEDDLVREIGPIPDLS